MQTTILHNPILKNLAQKILESITKNYPESSLELSDVYSHISSPPNQEMGHLAFPCFPLAKIAKTSPKQIAQNLASSMQSDNLIASIKAEGPYLNFFINSQCIGELVIDKIIDDSFFGTKFVDNPKKIMIEYSQPNTHKELHVGHLRNACLGNSLIELLRYGGQKVIAATYPGDVGTHVAKCLWYLEKHNNELPPEVGPKGPWLGKMYSKASIKLEDELTTDKEEENRAELTAILKSLEAKEGEYYETWLETREWSIDLMKEVYQWANIKFDRWYFESQVDASSLKRAKQYYKEGKYIESEGAIGMDLSEEKLGFCLMIKSDGNGMYSTKDIELAFQKFQEYDLDQNIYIVDTRQAYHFKQVFKALEKLDFPHAKDCYHLDYNFVELPSGAMSSRKGNIVPIMDLILQMEDTIKVKYLNRYKDQWSEEEINDTATIIAGGAIKYGMLRMDNGRKIIFDMEEWLKLDGETGPYLQYVHARIHSLCEKMGYTKAITPNWSCLELPIEEILMLKLMNFNSVVQTAAGLYKSSALCSYLYELGKLFNNFYNECPIGKAPNEDLKNTRLVLAKATGLIMEKGLKLLGIKAPLKM